jgi:hypothetical protein
VRKRDPRGAIERRRRARARVELVEEPQSGHDPDGSVGSRQTADVTLPREELERIWSPEYLERLAGTYWRFLTRVSLGILRVRYLEDAREIVVFGRPLVLLRFRAPEYEIGDDGGAVTWRIDKGVLVAPQGRDKGYLRITVRRLEQNRAGEDTVRVSSEVTNFYPLIAGWGWFSKVGRIIYRATQLRIHVIVTNAFLRSLARLDLAPSAVGALKAPEEPARELSPSARP